MLSPLNNLTPLTPAYSQKLTTDDNRRHFLDPDFFKPLSTEAGLSCTYLPEFYEAFSQTSSSSQHNELAMLVLTYMALEDKARLPLFHGASDRYIKQVLPAIQEILATRLEDNDTLGTKIHIMHCATQLGYLTPASDVFKGDVVLKWVSLIGMNLCDAYLPKANLRSADLRGANAQRSDLSGANLLGADLSEADFSWANLVKADLGCANLSGINLSKANLSGAILFRANLYVTNLGKINLSQANLTGANLSRADLRGADLRGAKLSGANITGAYLCDADLSETDLSGADLSSADLRRANLRKANLRGAIFSKADLEGAEYSETELIQTD